MKKQILSGVLAAVMLLSPAYAAESGASDSSGGCRRRDGGRGAEPQLVFASDKTLTGANGDTVKEIFKSRLDALGYKDYTLTVADDGSTITVEFPASVQVSHLADYLVQPAVFRVRRGRQVWLTNEDLKQVTSTRGSKDGTGCVVLTLTTRAARASRRRPPRSRTATATKSCISKWTDRPSPLRPFSSKIDSSSVNIENNFY